MNLEDLNKVIEELSETSKIAKADIIQVLSEYAQQKYGSNITSVERTIIDKIKEKIISTLYSKKDHTIVARRIDQKEVFGLDSLDMKYLENAGNELELEGMIEGNENYSKLTDNGILKAKEINGDLE